MTALATETERIDKLPDVKAQLIKESIVLKEAFESAAAAAKELEQAKVTLTKAQIARIENAVASYKLKKGEFPETLEVLTQGKTAALEKKDLIDPWDKQYQYGPTILSATGKPRIWTVRPDKKEIANWDKEKKE
jgi:hypothetical protein